MGLNQTTSLIAHKLEVFLICEQYLVNTLSGVLLGFHLQLAGTYCSTHLDLLPWSGPPGHFGELVELAFLALI